MRAAWCEQLGSVSDIVTLDVPDPVAAPGQVLVRISAAALNFPDVLTIGGRYQNRVSPPFIPGSEFAGVVVGSPAGWARLGTAVTGVVGSGAFAELIAVDLGDLRPALAGLDPVQSAAFHVTYTTAYHGLVTVGEAQPGQTVVVLGAAGGVGQATVDLAHRLGLRVIAAASSPARLQLCREYGADETVDYSREPLKDRLKALAPGGVDVVIDPVGGPLAEQALRAIGWGGRFVAVGFASGEIPRIPLNLVLLKGAQLRGFEMRGLTRHRPQAISAAEQALSSFVAQGMRPHVGARYHLDDIRAALEQVEGRRALGKVVLEIS
jgi:NADPH:quinone reductase